MVTVKNNNGNPVTLRPRRSRKKTWAAIFVGALITAAGGVAHNYKPNSTPAQQIEMETDAVKTAVGNSIGKLNSNGKTATSPEAAIAAALASHEEVSVAFYERSALWVKNMVGQVLSDGPTDNNKRVYARAINYNRRAAALNAVTSAKGRFLAAQKRANNMNAKDWRLFYRRLFRRLGGNITVSASATAGEVIGQTLGGVVTGTVSGIEESSIETYGALGAAARVLLMGLMYITLANEAGKQVLMLIGKIIAASAKKGGAATKALAAQLGALAYRTTKPAVSKIIAGAKKRIRSRAGNNHRNGRAGNPNGAGRAGTPNGTGRAGTPNGTGRAGTPNGAGRAGNTRGTPNGR